jgi:hypothetical protein
MVWQQIFFHPSLLLRFLDPGSGLGKNQDPGSGINIPDPQHCSLDLILGLLKSLKIPDMKCKWEPIREGVTGRKGHVSWPGRSIKPTIRNPNILANPDIGDGGWVTGQAGANFCSWYFRKLVTLTICRNQMRVWRRRQDISFQILPVN